MITKSIIWIKWYSLCIGALIITAWILILIKGNLLEGKLELSLHLISEFIMASMCLMGGIQLLRKKYKGLLFSLVGFAMIFYSTLNAIGYYIENNNFNMVVMLSMICSINFFFLIKIIKKLTFNI